MRFISKLSTKSLLASLTVLLNHANFSLELSNLSSSRSMSCQSFWLATGFPLAVFQSRFFQLFIQAGPSFVSLTDLVKQSSGLFYSFQSWQDQYHTWPCFESDHYCLHNSQ